MIIKVAVTWEQVGRPMSRALVSDCGSDMDGLVCSYFCCTAAQPSQLTFSVFKFKRADTRITSEFTVGVISFFIVRITTLKHNMIDKFIST